MSAPITKVVKNDAYTAPRPPVPVAPTRPNASTAAARASAAALQPVSRTLQQSTAETITTAPTPPQVSQCTSFFIAFSSSVSQLWLVITGIGQNMAKIIQLQMYENMTIVIDYK